MLHITNIGTGKVEQNNQDYALTVPSATDTRYSDAQLSSYRTHGDFHLRPPIRMRLKAKAEGKIHGTAGFGFWNHPFMPGERGVRLPKSVWFFYGSPPNNMALAKGVPGYGWKAATFDATRWPFFALLPTAPVAFPLMRLPFFYNRLWPIGQRAIGVSEKLLDENLLMDWHEYSLDWLENGVVFRVDGAVVHATDLSPKAPLGFIAWVDNQYAVVTPQGHFRYGLVKVAQSQTLIIRDISLSDNL